MLNFILFRLSTFFIVISLSIFLGIFFYFNNNFNFNLIFFLFFENNLFYDFNLKFFFEFFNYNLIFKINKLLFILLILGLFFHSYKGISHIFEEYLDLKLRRNIRNKIILNKKITVGFLFKTYLCNFFIFFSILLLIF